MPKNLLIVESPAKAKTIEKFLGKDFKVKSSYGHIRDLPKSEKAVDKENDYQPQYEISPDKKKVVKELRDWIKKVDEVWLATDEDREGEAISWHLCQVLGLDESQTKRIVFREITKPAIQKAIQHPRRLDTGLVHAQQARRVLDRLVGYDLSGLLQKTTRKYNLSAGRVQSVAVKLIVDREDEINDFASESSFRMQAFFQVGNEKGKKVSLKAESAKRPRQEGQARSFLEKCIGAAFSIQDIEIKPTKRKPAPPFTTSTLQQEASRKLGFSVSRTMSAAQGLYEAGHITYMRTDSINLSDLALQSAAAEIEKQFGKNYVQTRRYKSKNANAQEAHEAIRPTDFSQSSVTGSYADQKRLYDLIWKRAIASQMAEARLERTIVRIGISTMPDEELRAEGEVLKFDGFLKVYLESRDDEDEEEEEVSSMLPPLSVEQELPLEKMVATQRFTRPPSRFTEASLVKKLEEEGIGRPSTYAPTITKIIDPDRGYIQKVNREGVDRNFEVLTLQNGDISQETQTETTGAVKNKLVPTDMGITISKFLDKYFRQIMDYGFTADIEKEFDEISMGRKTWNDWIKEFYPDFYKRLKEVESENPILPPRILGKDPESGNTVLARMTRNGPVVQIGTPEELIPDEKPRYANLPPHTSMFTINLEEGLALFQLPRILGDYKGDEVSVAIGRYGPYVRFGDSFVSLPKDEDPFEVGLERAIELIKKKIDENRPVGTYQGLPIQKGKGRFGPYLKWNDLFVNVPKRYDFENLTQKEMDELIAAKVEKEANRYIQRWEKEKISIQNGRWGPFIKVKRNNVKLPKGQDGKKMTAEEAKALSLEEVKDIIEEQLPGSFKNKNGKGTTKSKAKTKKKK